MDGQPGRVGIEGREEGPADSQSWADRLLAGPMRRGWHAARLPPPAGSTCPPPSPHPAGPLDWVVEKETRNLEVLHGQSDLSSWYFIESAQVGGIVINVTVSLSSRLLSSAGRGGATKVRGVQAVGCV